jgi:hypothetical protein
LAIRFISHWESREAEARSPRWRQVMASFLYSMAASRASMASSSWNSVRSSCGDGHEWTRAEAPVSPHLSLS